MRLTANDHTTHLALVQDCARELTRQGTVPFTRGDLIACIQRTYPGCEANSINPIIQGVTDNLKGGAPGADGKRILHSVGRGRFVLYSKKDELVNGGLRETPSHNTRPKQTSNPEDVPESENALRDRLFGLLQERLGARRRFDLRAEGIVAYALPDGKRLNHASDILVSDSKSGKHVSIEIKYRSAVTDQFKCRAFDAHHMKQEHGGRIRTIMLYVKTNRGISIAQAERISYPFDVFIGWPVTDLGMKLVDRLEREIESFLSE